MIVKHFKEECLDAKNFICYQHNFKSINEINFYYWNRSNNANELNTHCVAKFTLKLKPNVNTQTK